MTKSDTAPTDADLVREWLAAQACVRPFRYAEQYGICDIVAAFSRMEEAKAT